MLKSRVIKKKENVMSKSMVIKKISSFLFLLILLSLTIGCSNSAKSSDTSLKVQSEAQNDVIAEVKWPKIVEVVVPAGAGGDTDFNSRLLAQQLSKRLSPNFVVSNVTGNSGATGSRQVKNGDNNGSTVLFFHTAFLVNQATGKADFGLDEFSFACIAAKNRGNVLVVRSALGISSLEELHRYTQSNPGELKMAANTGATSYVMAMQMKSAGFDMNVVDAGGGADRLVAILGDRVDVIFAAYGTVKDYINDGTLVALAMDSTEDLIDEEKGINIKAMKNQGYEDIKLPFYYFFAFPKGTDEALVQQFNDAVKDIVENDKEYQKKIYDAYLQKPYYSPSEGGFKTMDDVKTLLSQVDLSGEVSQ